MKTIVIFASGNGSNAQRIAEYFSGNPEVSIRRIYTNRPDAYVLTRAANLGLKTMVFDRHDFYETGLVLEALVSDRPDLIVLAGFLWKVPATVIARFQGRIINIHPALLPKYGGKGMYGSRVHEAVIGNGDKKSGISIHYINERYDEGEIIFRAECPVSAADTPETLAAKIHELEYAHFPVVIEQLLFNGPSPGRHRS